MLRHAKSGLFKKLGAEVIQEFSSDGFAAASSRTNI
jgi:hypothetical protein